MSCLTNLCFFIGGWAIGCYCHSKKDVVNITTHRTRNNPGILIADAIIEGVNISDDNLTEAIQIQPYITTGYPISNNYNR